MKLRNFREFFSCDLSECKKNFVYNGISSSSYGLEDHESVALIKIALDVFFQVELQIFLSVVKMNLFTSLLREKRRI